MSKYAKANDYLMQAKADKLKEIGCKVDYYTKEDRENIFSWSDLTNELIYKNIRFVIIHSLVGGLSIYFCPFCSLKSEKNKPPYVKNQFCKDCQYGKNHEMCDEVDSDWKKVALFINNRYYKDCSFTHYDLFPIEFYKKVLKKMEAIVNE